MEDKSEKIVIPYTPSDKKRWEVSNDPHSRERIQKLLQMYKDVGKELTYKDPDTGAINSVPIAIVLEGSLSKGKKLTEETKDYSDIDFITFYDHDELVKHKDDIVSFHPEGTFAREYGRKYKEMQADPRGFQDVFTGEENLDLLNYTTTSTGIRAVFPEIADRCLPNPEKIHFKVIPLQIDGEYSIYERVMQKYNQGIDKSISERGGNPQEYYVAQFFHLDVGGGMKRFVQSFLQKLNDHPSTERGEIWDFVRNAVEKTERNGVIPNDIKHQFPQTYEDACKFYGLEPKSEGLKINSS